MACGVSIGSASLMTSKRSRCPTADLVSCLFQFQCESLTLGMIFAPKVFATFIASNLSFRSYRPMEPSRVRKRKITECVCGSRAVEERWVEMTHGYH